MTISPTIIYQKGRFTVTRSDVRTPTFFYPVQDTIGRRRKDIQFMAVALAALISGALWVYWDLWFLYEKVTGACLVATALIIAATFSVLQIDARGFPSRIFIARSKTIKGVFTAITQAKALQTASISSLADHEATSE